MPVVDVVDQGPDAQPLRHRTRGGDHRSRVPLRPEVIGHQQARVAERLELEDGLAPAPAGQARELDTEAEGVGHVSS